MNIEKSASDERPKLEFEDVDLIAMRAVRGLEDQVNAFNEMPLLYVECVLSHLGDADTVSWEDIPELLGRLAPWLKPEECLSLTDLYVKSRRGFESIHAS